MSVLELVDQVSVYSDWVKQQVWSLSVWCTSKPIHPRDTPCTVARTTRKEKSCNNNYYFFYHYYCCCCYHCCCCCCCCCCYYYSLCCFYCFCCYYCYEYHHHLVLCVCRVGADLREEAPVKDAVFDKQGSLWTVSLEDDDRVFKSRVSCIFGSATLSVVWRTVNCVAEICYEKFDLSYCRDPLRWIVTITKGRMNRRVLYSNNLSSGYPVRHLVVSVNWQGEVESLICNFYLSVAACKLVRADLSLRYTSMLLRQ